MKQKNLFFIVCFIAANLILTTKTAEFDLDPENLLHKAARNNDIETIQALLAAGVNVDAKEPSRANTALMIAAEYQHPQAVQVLLDAKANVNAANTEGWTPLIFATQRGSTEVARTLVAAGADVNYAESNGFSPLMFAAVEGFPEIVRILLNAGADVNHKSNPNLTALMLTADVDHTSNLDLTALMLAATQAESEIVQLLLDAGAEIDYSLDDNLNPLNFAANNEDILTVTALLKAGTKIPKNLINNPIILKTQALIQNDITHIKQPAKKKNISRFNSPKVSGQYGRRFITKKS